MARTKQTVMAKRQLLPPPPPPLPTAADYERLLTRIARLEAIIEMLIGEQHSSDDDDDDDDDDDMVELTDIGEEAMTYFYFTPPGPNIGIGAVADTLAH